MRSLSEAFNDKKFKEEVQRQLPGLIAKADIEASRVGNTGLEKGSFRKKYLIDFFIDHLSGENVETGFPIGMPDIDVKIFTLPVKIKTITGKRGIKIKWTIDRGKVENYLSNYNPSYGILLVRLNWDMKERNRPSGLFWIPLEAQQRVLKRLGTEKYLKPPKLGTNSRGIELSREALKNLLNDIDTKHIDINWPNAFV